MTPALCDDLINFSFQRHQDVAEESKKHWNERGQYGIHHFSPFFLGCLKRLVRYHFTVDSSAYSLYYAAIS